MSNVYIQNLSSKNVLVLSGSVSKISKDYSINWDSVDVIGRMNGIKNYKNTTKSMSMFIDNIVLSDSSKVLSPNSFLRKHEYNQNFANHTWWDSKAVSYDLNTLFNQSTTDEQKMNRIDSFFYPSYIEENIEDKSLYFMNSPPMFKIYYGEKLNMELLCIIKSFKFQVLKFNKETIETLSLQLELEEINTNIIQMSSRVVNKNSGSQ